MALLAACRIRGKTRVVFVQRLLKRTTKGTKVRPEVPFNRASRGAAYCVIPSQNPLTLRKKLSP